MNAVGGDREMLDEMAVVGGFEVAFECEVAFANSDLDGLFAELFDVLFTVVIAKVHRPDVVFGGFKRLDKRVSALADEVVEAPVECFKVVHTY